MIHRHPPMLEPCQSSDGLEQRLWTAFSREIAIETLGENEFAVFNGRFWDSSLLNAVDVCLLRHLLAQVQSVTQEELVHWAASELELPLDDQLHHYVSQSLEQMEYVGLIYQRTVH